MQKLLMLSSAIVRQTNYVLMIVSTYILIVLTAGVTIDVIMRYFFNSPIVGANQLSEYAMVWLCFLGAGWVLTKRGHVAVTFLEQQLFHMTKSQTKKYSLFVDLMCLCYTLPLLWLTGKETWVSFREGIVLTGDLGGIPEALMYFWVFVGFYCLSAQLVVNIAANILGIELPANAPDNL
jgi:TRAP-type C4-dicarboxylate transport system permease small subunit